VNILERSACRILLAMLFDFSKAAVLVSVFFILDVALCNSYETIIGPVDLCLLCKFLIRPSLNLSIFHGI
jgi:hypothetical protein